MLDTQPKYLISQNSNWSCNTQQNFVIYEYTRWSCWRHQILRFTRHQPILIGRILCKNQKRLSIALQLWWKFCFPRRIWTKILPFFPCDWVIDTVNRLVEIVLWANGEYTKYSDTKCKQQKSSCFDNYLSFSWRKNAIIALGFRLQPGVWCNFSNVHGWVWSVSGDMTLKKSLIVVRNLLN